MLLKYLLPILALLGVGMAVYTVMAGNKSRPPAEPAVLPAAAPFAGQVAGAGLVEASTENIALGSPVGGIIQAVGVKAGDRVEAGAPLFVVDDRTVRAELASREAAAAVALAALGKLEAQPRPEDLPPLQARLAGARSTLDDLRNQLTMYESAEARAVIREELSRRRFAVTLAEARVLEAEADLALTSAGAWKQDIAVAQAELDSARARVRAARVELDRHTVRAPVAGEILKVNVRMGESVQAGVGGRAGGGGVNTDDGLIVMGDTRTLHVRVDVDENDSWRVRPRSHAKASIRGNPDLRTDLRFVRFEPYIIPKRSLTGASTERVDTRVLQVIFAFDAGTLPVYVGQQMDVFIEAPSGQAPDAGAAALTSPPGRGG